LSEFENIKLIGVYVMYRKIFIIEFIYFITYTKICSLSLGGTEEKQGKRKKEIL
jgi:hypothetical protein